MAKMLVSPANFLLLDEPTNHLDMRAKDVLLDAIREFSGTVLFVSHDRYFIDGLATRVFEVEAGRVHIYPGNYEDYLFRKQGGIAKIAEAAAANPHIDHATGMFKPVKQVGSRNSGSTIEPGGPFMTASPSWVGSATESSGSTHEIEGSLDPVTPAPIRPRPDIKRLNPIKLKHLETRVTELETELTDLEARILAAEQQQAIFTTAEAAQALAAEIHALRDRRAASTAEWEDLALQLEEQTTA
jgi:ATP-binding cassette subfamily F protein 3